MRVASRIAAGILLLAPFPLLLSGCTEPKAGKPTQVVARVNDSEISLLQLEQAMKARPGATTADGDRRQIIERLVNRELAVQQALARKLDRQPEVMLRLEEMRREVLASAFAEQVAATRPRPSREAVESFYSSHPELFSKRKIYHLRELMLPTTSAHFYETKKRLAARQPLDEIADWLVREKAGHTEQNVLRAAEQLPLEALNALHQATEGQVVIFESPRAIYVYRVLRTQPSPLDMAAAMQFIVDYLARQEGQRTMAAEIQRLRSVASIEYLGPPAAGAPATAKSAN